MVSIQGNIINIQERNLKHYGRVYKLSKDIGIQNEYHFSKS